MSFWIKIDVAETGSVKATTYSESASGNPLNPIRARTGATVSQALRNMATALVYAKAETVGTKEPK